MVKLSYDREANDHVIFGLNDQEYKNNNYKKRMVVLKKFFQLCLILSISGTGLYIHCHLLVVQNLGQNDCFLKLSASGDFFN